jgi:sphingolipid delta-4 desaturase
MSYLVKDFEFGCILIALTYLISGTLNHSLVLAMHELSHDLFFENRLINQIFGVFVNLPIGFAAYFTFRAYHAEHHTSQGVDGDDMDIPSILEAKIF